MIQETTTLRHRAVAAAAKAAIEQEILLQAAEVAKIEQMRTAFLEDFYAEPESVKGDTVVCEEMEFTFRYVSSINSRWSVSLKCVQCGKPIPKGNCGNVEQLGKILLAFPAKDCHVCEDKNGFMNVEEGNDR